MAEFRMPSLGADMDVGTIMEWLVKPGDAVKRGQIVAVVDTAKAAIEIEAFESGVIEEILVDVGRQVPVGTPLAMIGPAGAEPNLPEELVVETVHKTDRIAYRLPEEMPRATPPVRHLAQQLGVGLDTVVGTGPDGHVTHDDVVRAAAPIPGAVPSIPTRTRRRTKTPGVGQGAGQGAPTADRRQPTAVTPARTRTAAEGRLLVSPRARRIAAERGIDLASVLPTGGGAVTGDDVTRAAAEAAAAEATAPAAAGAATTVIPRGVAAGSGAAAGGQPAEVRPGRLPAPGRPAGATDDRKAAMRTAIANLMSRSNAEIPHYHVTQTMDLAPALTWLRAHNDELPVARRLVPAVVFLRATVLAAQAVPDLNGHWLDGALRRAEHVDLGVAVATRGGGLVTPAIPDAGRLGVEDLMAHLTDLVGRARRGNLKQAEMAGASITVSALGESGPDALYGVIFPPQVALVGVGGIVERPWAVEGMLTVRPTATIVLAADHRASDGRTASAFLAAFAHALAHPEEL